MSIFGSIERHLDDFYPYRRPIAVTAVLLVVLLLIVAYRRGVHRSLWRHKWLTAAVAVPLLAVAIPIGNYTLSPLWTRTTLIEESPLVAAAGQLPTATSVVPPTATRAATPTPTKAPKVVATPTTPLPQPTPTARVEPTPSPQPTEAPTATPEPTPPFEPHVARSGTLASADDFHFAEGTALLIEVAPGSYVLRLEGVSVRNGPDLFVYLSPSVDELVDGALNLGGLKATDGSFNYDIPPGTDVAAFQGVVIWCRQFSVLFGTALLA